jgi:hypothetical protein
MTPEQIEAEVRHTRDDLAGLKTELHREMLISTRWLVGTMIVLQIPTWVGMLQIWNFLATIASKLPK